MKTYKLSMEIDAMRIEDQIRKAGATHILTRFTKPGRKHSGKPMWRIVYVIGPVVNFPPHYFDSNS